MMKNFTIYICFFFFVQSMFAQILVQGTILKTGSNSVTIYGKPNLPITNAIFDGVNICISIPDQGANNPDLIISVNHMPTLNWTTVGSSPYVTNGRAYYTLIGNDNNIVAPLSWLAGSSYPIITFTFNSGAGEQIVQLNDLSPDGGAGFQSYWYVQAIGFGDITDYDNMFYGVGAVNNGGLAPSYVPTADPVSLPINLTSFTARPLNNTDVELNWVTTGEINSSRFDVERSINGKEWSQIRTVVAGGNSVGERSYTFVDENVFNPKESLDATFYYRLKMADINGSFKYSDVRQAGFKGHTLIVGELFPNPSGSISASVQLPVSAMEETDILIDIYDSRGMKVSSDKSSLSKGNNSLNIVTNHLSTGIYHVRLSLSKGGTYDRKLVVQ